MIERKKYECILMYSKSLMIWKSQMKSILLQIFLRRRHIEKFHVVQIKYHDGWYTFSMTFITQINTSDLHDEELGC